MESSLQKYTTFLLFVTLLITGLIVGEQLMVPFAWSFLFAFVMHPLCNFLEHKKFSRASAAVFSTLVFCVVGGAIFFFLVYEAVNIIKEEATLYEKVKIGIDQLTSSVERTFGLSIQALGIAPSGTSNMGGIIGWVAWQISKLSQNIVTLTLIPMYLFFVLNYRALARRFMLHKFSGERLEQAQSFFANAQRSIKSYLAGTLLLTGICAMMSFVILLLFGVRYAFFFGVFIAVLNLIPYIGNLIAFIVILLFMWITKDSGWAVLFAGISLYTSNLVQENFLRPKLVGDKMEMNAMMVFTAVIVGGMVWGFSGMVLFIPMVGILQALVNSHPDWKGYAILFEEPNRSED
jgi:predicted PurR-regulated permease PerM